jgi:hypothetical protein
MIRSGYTTYGYPDPFAGARIHWTTGLQLPCREDIYGEVMNMAFRSASNPVIWIWRCWRCWPH